MDHDFQGRDNDKLPEIPEEFVNLVSDRYIELYETITGEKFIKANAETLNNRIESNVKNCLNSL